ncbi:MAG: hypothetical protein RLZZ142_1020 [Verrucomicrobiota bacterium]
METSFAEGLESWTVTEALPSFSMTRWDWRAKLTVGSDAETEGAGWVAECNTQGASGMEAQSAEVMARRVGALRRDLGAREGACWEVFLGVMVVGVKGY